MSNTTGNLLELFFPPRNLQEIYEVSGDFIVYFASLLVCHISYSSCISDCTSIKYIAVNQDQLILRLVIWVCVS